MNRLLSLVEPYQCIAITGLAKNTGKTSVLNAILSHKSPKTRGITSIGYDGESIDQVTGTEKPVVYVKSGTLLATADGLLSRCDFTKELLKYTGFNTPMGEVIIIKALSDGYAQIAGPSTRSQMEATVKMLQKAGAKQIFIDGAASRKSTAAISFSDACILATGAAFSTNIEEILEETGLFTKLLTLPKYDFSKKEPVEIIDTLEQGEESFLKRSFKAVNLKGAITSKTIESLLSRKGSIEGLKLIGEDGTRFLIKTKQLNSLIQRGVKLFVENPINLIAVTVNPKATDGTSLNSEVLCKELQKLLPIPVLDIKIS